MRVGLVSNADDDGLVQRAVVRLGFAPFLDPVVSSAGLIWRKPIRPFFVTCRTVAITYERDRHGRRRAQVRYSRRAQCRMHAILIDQGEDIGGSRFLTI